MSTYRLKAGFGDVNIPIVDAYAAPSECTTYGAWFLSPGCWGHSVPYWQQQAGAVAPPPAPPIVPGTVSTLPAGTQDAAQATVDALANQQMAAQQAVNAAGVDSSLYDLSAGGLYQAGAAVGSGVSLLGSIPWWGWALGVGVVVVVLAKGGR